MGFASDAGCELALLATKIVCAGLGKGGASGYIGAVGVPARFVGAPLCASRKTW
jgi:hypothetical protein